MDNIVEQELTNVAAYSGKDLSTIFAQISFKTRRELQEAARILNPADLFNSIITNLTTVATNAATRFKSNIR